MQYSGDRLPNMSFELAKKTASGFLIQWCCTLKQWCQGALKEGRPALNYTLPPFGCFHHQAFVLGCTIPKALAAAEEYVRRLHFRSRVLGV